MKDNEIREKVEHVDLSFKEWFTLESVYEIIDEDTIKSNFKDKIISKFKDISITNQENDKKFARFREICRKLNLMEIRDKSIDEEIICKEKNNHNLQPAPNYNQLKKDAEELKIKVICFYFHAQNNYSIERNVWQSVRKSKKFFQNWSGGF